jgi:ribosomal-protein-alanine acetyltransferase
MIHLESMQPQQVAAVAALEAQSFSTPWSQNAIASELDNPWAIWLVALEGETLLGYVGAQYGPDGGDIVTIATDPGHRGHGIGKALIGSLETLLREKQLRWLTLEVRPSNAPALGLYQSLGFQQVGRRPRYYKKPTEDALLLTKFFEGGPDHADTGN